MFDVRSGALFIMCADLCFESGHGRRAFSAAPDKAGGDLTVLVFFQPVDGNILHAAKRVEY